ncbi:ATP-dependent RNA helicase dbp2 [Venturia nashicola]|nr:ATP-dependent RNA helicase dbp2 [Venturia nashicola]
MSSSLLAFANAHGIYSQRGSDELDHDQIGSNSSTPPGAHTPRPDLVDKRLPGILNSYFGQVRDSFRTRLKSVDSLSTSVPPTNTRTSTSTSTDGDDENKRKPMSLDPKTMGGAPLPTAPASPTRESEAQDLPIHSRPSQLESSIPYPTPPPSSQSSLHRPSRGENGGSSEKRIEVMQDNLKEQDSAPEGLRRHTFTTASPLSSVTVAPTVTASYISNPATEPSASNISEPLIAQLSASRRPSSSSPSQKSSGLTQGASTPPQLQSTPSQTPPQTPRNRSQEGRRGTGCGTGPATPSKRGDLNEATMGPVLGKLAVEISEGRGLRTSLDPYIVCQFQCAEYISEGPKNTDMDISSGRGPGGITISRNPSERGPAQAIPMRSRQSSRTGRDMAGSFHETTDPQWEHKAVFDVVGEQSELDVSVYDRSNQEAFLGHVRFCPRLVASDRPLEGWFRLEPRDGEPADQIRGEIHLRLDFTKTDKKHYGPEDFQILKLIGKGTFGQVFQVRKKDTGRIYAMKVLSKKVIVQKKEVIHTIGERNILVRTATTESPFIVGLKFSFQTPTDLYLVTDYMSGGELFWHLQKEGRFDERRAKFYIAELILALEHLHNYDIVYRDLKPENILLDANGHIALCDFGLSKANLKGEATTNTFCGTTEYLAPEVLLDEAGYTKMVDFWSLGVLVFEMCCGWSPFYAEDTQQMYKNIAFGKVRFPRDALSTEGRNFVKGLLNRNPRHRLGCAGDAIELKSHPFFDDVDWEQLTKKNVVPPFKPKLKGELDVSNFDPEFTTALNNPAGSLNARAAALASGVNPASTPLSPTVQANFKGFTYVDESNMENQFRGRENDLDQMDEDDHEDDDWEKVYSNKRGDRMSGVVSNNNENDDGILGGFDV